jgi:hypothetical protein
MALLFWEQLDSAYHRQLRRAKCVLARDVSGNVTYQALELPQIREVYTAAMRRGYIVFSS